MRFKSSIKYLSLGLLLLIFVFQSLILGLPLILEAVIKTNLPKAGQGFSPEFSIEKIGFNRTLIRNIQVGEDLDADLMELIYEWGGAPHFKIKKIIISGMSIHLRQDESNKIWFNSMAFPMETSDTNRPINSPVIPDEILSFIPDQAVLKNVNLYLKTPDRNIHLPMGLLAQLNPSQGRADVQADLTPFGQHLTVNLSGNLNSGLTVFNLRTKEFNPGCISPMLSDLGMNIGLSGPVNLELLHDNTQEWQLNMSGLGIRQEGLPEVTIHSLVLSLKEFSKGLALKGILVADAGPGIPASAWQLDGLYDSQAIPSFDLKIKHTSQIKDLILTGILPVQFTISKPEINFSISGTSDQQTGQLTVAGNEFTAAIHGSQDKHQLKTDIKTKKIALTAEFQGSLLNTNKKIDINFDGKLAGIKLVSGKNQGSIKEASLSGTMWMNKDLQPRVSLRARIKKGGLILEDEKIIGSNIEIDLPFSYPHRTQTQDGKLSISLAYDNRIQAEIDGVLAQIPGNALSLKGQVSSPNLDPLMLEFDLKAGMDQTPWADLHVQSHRFSLTPAHLKQVMPDLTLPGKASINMSSDTWVTLRHQTIDTRAQVVIHDGSLEFPDLDLTVQGITGAIAFNDLLTPETLPGQEVFIKQIDAGQFSFDKAEVRFSIEDGKSLNLENLKFNWCNGLVSTESVRLPAKDNKLSLTLYCDRLEMASLLKQIGAFDAEGGGSLNGRIPVTYANGDISFDNGFLFSTPGQGGRVFVKDLDRMMTGFPKDTLEFNQLDMAGEALKDFQYKWAKLKMNTKGDTLEVQMELDGKPNQIMPFEYRKEINSFVRVAGESPGSNFQGVKLDVNLKLPFNRVMKFGNKLNDILN